MPGNEQEPDRDEASEPLNACHGEVRLVPKVKARPIFDYCRRGVELRIEPGVKGELIDVTQACHKPHAPSRFPQWTDGDLIHGQESERNDSKDVEPIAHPLRDGTLLSG